MIIRKISVVVVLAATFLLFAGERPAMAGDSLYDRLGGIDAITVVVEKFTANQLAGRYTACHYVNRGGSVWGEPQAVYSARWGDDRLHRIPHTR